MQKNEQYKLPLITLYDKIIFPYVRTKIKISSITNLNALKEALDGKKSLFCALLKEKKENYTIEDVYSSGSIIFIEEVLEESGNTYIIALGKSRAELIDLKIDKNLYFAEVEVKKENNELNPNIISIVEKLKREFLNFYKKKDLGELQKFQKELIEKAKLPTQICDYIANFINLSIEKQLIILEDSDLESRINNLSLFFDEFKKDQIIEDELNFKTKIILSTEEREKLLKTKMRALQMSLSDGGEDVEDVQSSYEAKLDAIKNYMDQDTIQKIKKEINKLKKTNPYSQENGLIKSYLDTVFELPWGIQTAKIKKITKAQEILNKGHYGLEKPKEAILDYIASYHLRKEFKGEILCIVGPPGIGKTSLVSSIAEALGRKYLRLALGGMHDESEIRGHRRTYLGALPGKIIHHLRLGKTSDPVLLLDEIDKLAKNVKGDPSAALLEVLDPEQNKYFTDNYMEIPFDLSKVMFIATANNINAIPEPLKDRMEIIELSAYTTSDKVIIAQNHLIEKQKKELNIASLNIEFPRESLLYLINNYTYEAGVRNLERNIAKVFKKIIRDLLEEHGGVRIILSKPFQENYHFSIDVPYIKKCLGNEFFKNKIISEDLEVGLIYGLAWTPLGGSILPIEGKLLEGKGRFILTGRLGEVMKESATIAKSVLRSEQVFLGFDLDLLDKKDIHLHFPEGSVKKDGPSAGMAMTLSIASLLLNKVPKEKVAMTGEISLSGKILPVGGVEDKLLAAHKHGFKKVFLPIDNEREWNDLKQEVKDVMEVIFIKNIHEALKFLF